MNKKFIAIHNALEKGSIIQFVLMCVVLGLCLFCFDCDSVIALTYFLGVQVIALMLTTAACFATTTVWLFKELNDQINAILNLYEESLKEDKGASN